MPSLASARYTPTLLRLLKVQGVGCVFSSLAAGGVAAPFFVMVDSSPNLGKVPSDALDFSVGGTVLHTLTAAAPDFAAAVTAAGHTFDSLVGLSLRADGTRDYRIRAVAPREESVDIFVHTAR